MPVLLERDGALLGALGAMGGSVQPQIHTQVLLRLFDGATPAEAVAAPRFAVAATEALVEEDCDATVSRSLHDAGLTPTVVPARSEDLGHAQVIWDGDAGSDPRADGSALVR